MWNVFNLKENFQLCVFKDDTRSCIKCVSSHSIDRNIDTAMLSDWMWNLFWWECEAKNMSGHFVKGTRSDTQFMQREIERSLRGRSERNLMKKRDRWFIATPQSDKVNIGKKELKLLQINSVLVMPVSYMNAVRRST